MRIVTIYHLNDTDFGDEYLALIKQHTKSDLVVAFSAENQLEGIQYPYITIDNYDS